MVGVGRVSEPLLKRVVNKWDSLSHLADGEGLRIPRLCRTRGSRGRHRVPTGSPVSRGLKKDRSRVMSEKTESDRPLKRRSRHD